MLVFKEHWLDRFWCSNLDDATEYISPAYKNEKKFKKHLHQYRRLPRHIKDCFDIVFKKIWDEYGVMFTYEIEKNPKIKRIKKITFKNVA